MYPNPLYPREDTSKDEEIAKMLQRLENLEVSSKPNNAASGSLINNPNGVNNIGAPPGFVYNPIPQPSMNSYSQFPANLYSSFSNSSFRLSQLNPAEFDFEKSCVICKQHFQTHYYTFPSCLPNTVHNYCETCAKRLIVMENNGPVTYSVSCKYCHTKTELRTIANLDTFRKSFLPKAEIPNPNLFKDGTCPYHDHILIYFCYDCYEPICATCSSGYHHKNHKLEDLDTAFHFIINQLRSSYNATESKRSKVNQNIQQVLNSMDLLSQNAERAQNKINQDIDNLIHLLEQKKITFNQKITDLKSLKSSELEAALQKYSKKLEELEDNVAFISNATNNPNFAQHPLEFFQEIRSKGKQYMKDITNPNLNNNIQRPPVVGNFMELERNNLSRDINYLSLRPSLNNN